MTPRQEMLKTILITASSITGIVAVFVIGVVIYAHIVVSRESKIVNRPLTWQDQMRDDALNICAMLKKTLP